MWFACRGVADASTMSPSKTKGPAVEHSYINLLTNAAKVLYEIAYNN